MSYFLHPVQMLNDSPENFKIATFQSL